MKSGIPVESGPIKLVVHYADGRVIKGYAHDFYPNKPTFHLFPAAAEPSGRPIEVRIKDLKAVCFVRDFAGDDFFNEPKKFVEGEQPLGRKVEVTFVDGRVLVGTTLGYDPRRPGFFFIPADPQSNTLRVFAVAQAVRDVRYL